MNHIEKIILGMIFGIFIFLNYMDTRTISKLRAQVNELETLKSASSYEESIDVYDVADCLRREDYCLETMQMYLKYDDHVINKLKTKLKACKHDGNTLLEEYNKCEDKIKEQIDLSELPLITPEQLNKALEIKKKYEQLDGQESYLPSLEGYQP